MSRKISKAERYRIKRNYINDNLDLYNRAFAEKAAGNHLRHKHSGALTAYGQFIAKVREDFQYSRKTVDIDIWNKFVFYLKEIPVQQ